MILESTDAKMITMLKKRIVEIAQKNNLGHIPSCFSSLEILVTLYTRVVNITKVNVKMVDRDRVILSKEHCKLGLVVLLEYLDYIPNNSSETFLTNGARLGHDIFKEVIGEDFSALDASFGTLGHGIGVGIGMALANPHNHIYVIVGDGELQEGSCWEGLLFIGHNQINNITIIVDKNNTQGSDLTKNILDTSSNLASQISSFKMDVIECNGHNIEILEKAIKQKVEHPKCIIADTIKGKECLFVAQENGFAYLHNHPYTREQFAKIMENINNG